MTRVFALEDSLLLERDGVYRRPARPLLFDEIFQAEDPAALVDAAFADGAVVTPEPERAAPGTATPAAVLRAPLQSQEIWAAGVTYLRSKTARMEESADAGGATFYDKVYDADRPELFFKSTPHRVSAPGAPVRIRADSQWNVPEPELTLAIDSRGRIFGYTAGNDMSSRDIEGENPLYLPQAKVYTGSAAVGPCLVIDTNLPGSDTVIALDIYRAGARVFEGTTTVERIKRPLPSLAEWLFRDNSFPHGCYLMTGTGIVPPDSFTLRSGDEVRITIEPVGTLINPVA
jgi:2-dehydro-3-deoxy-D-arabinonate dehydratase